MSRPDVRVWLVRRPAAALKQAFGPSKLYRIEANIQPENADSIALVKRLGFRREELAPR